MKNVTVILGPPQSGKTSLAKVLANGNISYCFQPQSKAYLYNLRSLVPETEIIIIDEVSEIEEVKYFIRSESLTFCPFYSKESVTINPDFVIVSSKLSAADFEQFKDLNISIFQLTNSQESSKAQKWDELDNEVYKFYFDENDEELLEPNGDLGDIGELAARKLGYI